MKQKILFFLLFSLLAEVLLSCCDCPDTVTRRYTNKSFTVANLDNSGSGPVVATAATVPKAAYGIRLQIVRETTACGRRALFLPVAYAFSCGCPPELEILPRDSVTAIHVFTLADFDGNHPAGSDVSAYFKSYTPYYFLGIPDYLQKSRTVLLDESELQARIDLLLMTAPARTGAHRFRVRLTLSDNRVLELDTPPIELA